MSKITDELEDMIGIVEELESDNVQMLDIINELVDFLRVIEVYASSTDYTDLEARNHIREVLSRRRKLLDDQYADWDFEWIEVN